MEEVVISTSRTEKGYSGSCELLPGWVVAFSGDFSGFIDYVRESIDFFVDCAKEDKEEYVNDIITQISTYLNLEEN